jgi:KDO2-lipid IV(A) lauroyltransferase
VSLNIDSIANSAASIKVLSAIARVVPRSLGHRIADLIAGRLAAQRNSKLARSVRANQWVVNGEQPTSEMLDLATREVLRNSARSIFDLYHHLGDEAAMGRLILFDGELQHLVGRKEFEERGLLFAAIHLSSFDFALRWLCLQPIRPLVLTVPETRGGRRAEFEMRRATGMNLVQATVGGLRQALRHLEGGGAVLTGIDRPVLQPRLLPRFFGRPAALPVEPVLLAMRAHVPTAVIAVTSEPDGKYHVAVSEMIELKGDPRNEKDALENAEAVLRVAEGFIRRAPQQWVVPLSVWPSAVELAAQ